MAAVCLQPKFPQYYYYLALQKQSAGGGKSNPNAKDSGFAYHIFFGNGLLSPYELFQHAMRKTRLDKIVESTCNAVLKARIAYFGQTILQIINYLN